MLSKVTDAQYLFIQIQCILVIDDFLERYYEGCLGLQWGRRAVSFCDIR